MARERKVAGPTAQKTLPTTKTRFGFGTTTAGNGGFSCRDAIGKKGLSHSPFFNFLKCWRTANGGGGRGKDSAIRAGRAWRALPAEQRARYQKVGCSQRRN